MNWVVNVIEIHSLNHTLAIVNGKLEAFIVYDDPVSWEIQFIAIFQKLWYPIGTVITESISCSARKQRSKFLILMRDQEIIFCIPIFNDWESARLLLEQIDSVVYKHKLNASVLLVDDASTDCIPKDLAETLGYIQQLEILKLRRNLGHQRAIALGLTFIYQERPCRAVVIMDGDGEDSPSDVIRLLEQFENHRGKRIIFAKRARRSEGLKFRVFYQFYKIIHWGLTGRKVEVGNFSIIPSQLLEHIVGISELWNHYAASVFKARLPIDKVAIARAKRLQGRSKMNFFSLVIHGLSAISVFGEEVGVRLLFAASILMLITLSGFSTVVIIKLFTPLAIPGWATSAAAGFLTIFLNAFLLSLIFVFTILQSRNNSSFLPLRDYKYYITGLIDSRYQPKMQYLEANDD